MRAADFLVLLFFLVQVSLAKNQGSKEDVPKEHFVVEALLYIDYTEYKTWLNLKNGVESMALEEMKNFYHYVMKRVNEVYKSIESPSFSLSISLVNYFVNKENSIFMDSSTNYKDGEPINLNNNEASEKADEFYKRSQLDQTKERTKYDVAIYIGNLDMNGILGVGALKSACTHEPTVVATHLGSNELIFTIVHEMGHTLGADHDLMYKGCPPELLYIMSPTDTYAEIHLVQNSFIFSHCSIDSFAEYLKELSFGIEGNCLEGPTTIFVPEEFKYPGQVHSFDQQCKLIHGPQSYYCGGGSVCRDLLCYQPKLNACTWPYRQTAADGSQCGNKKWCLASACVYDPAAPAFDEVASAADHCHLGDYKGKVDDELLCDKVRSDPAMCYKAFNRNKCCQTCEDIEAVDKFCGYGDREKWCESTIKAHPMFCKLKSAFKDCCVTCPKHYHETDIGSLDPIQTDDCEDFWQACQNVSPELCYKQEDLCCGSCSVIKKSKKIGCEFGDKIKECTSEMCGTEKAEACCFTCEK